MRRSLLALAFSVVLIGGCQKKPPMSYNSLDQAGMYSSAVDQLKKLNVTESEVLELAKLKRAGASDQFCVALVNSARAHNHDFTSADAASNLSRAGYSDEQILAMAQSDQMDVLSGEAITLKLIGLSNATVQEIISKRAQGLTTLSSQQIGELKNTGLTEKQILQMIDNGITSDEADREIEKRQANRAHSNTGFVRVRGRRR